MEFQQLHDVPEYMNECAEVLNEEWKRSLTARIYSLEKSKDTLPVCLVLLEKDESGKTKVVGHSRLSDIRGQIDKSCLVESVVVKKSHRGKGYGRIIMEKSEDFAARKGYKTMYLTTHDKQDFYQHLGYEFCNPVVSLGSDILPDHLAEKLFGNMKLNTVTQEQNKNSAKLVKSSSDTNGKCKKGTDSDKKPPPNSAPVAPPPPPPPPPSVPAPPTAPPPPKNEAGSGETVVRWDPSKVAWMKKSIS